MKSGARGKAAAVELKSDVLPLPKRVVEHHGSTLRPLMAQWKRNEQIPPVLLITGQSGIGKREIAYWLSQWLLCERNRQPEAELDDQQSGFDLLGGLAGSSTQAAEAPKEDAPLDPCGECNSCQQALKNTWVDFTEIRPVGSSGTLEEGETGKLKIEQFRNMTGAAGFGAREGSHRIFLIANAELMTPQAANSLLKILEEPPRGWIFMLTADDPSLLLPTLVSRCQRIRLKPFAAADLLELLAEADVPAGRRPICAKLAEGSWQKALELGQDEVWEKREQVLRFVVDPKAELNSVLEWSAADSGSLSLLLDHLEQITSQLIQASLQQNPANYPFVDNARALATYLQNTVKIAGGVEPARVFWIERLERMAKARQEMLAPLNKKILVQDLLLPWLRTG